MPYKFTGCHLLAQWVCTPNKLEYILDTGHGLRRQSPPQSGDYAGRECCLGEDHSVHIHSQRSSHCKEVQACEQPGRCNHTKVRENKSLFYMPNSILCMKLKNATLINKLYKDLSTVACIVECRLWYSKQNRNKKFKVQFVSTILTLCLQYSAIKIPLSLLFRG